MYQAWKGTWTSVVLTFVKELMKYWCNHRARLRASWYTIHVPSNEMEKCGENPTVKKMDEGKLQVTKQRRIATSRKPSPRDRRGVTLVELKACLRERGRCEDVFKHGHRVRSSD